MRVPGGIVEFIGDSDLAVVAKVAGLRWERLIGISRVAELLSPLDCRPSAVGIKVANHLGLLARHAEFFELGDQSHFGPVSGIRTIATIRKAKPFGFGMRYVKILQRRPGRNDELGLEHMDLAVPGGTDLASLCSQLQELVWLRCEPEANDAHAWLSIRHDGFEFKLVDHDLWAVLIAEMQSVLEPK
jgi:hypothetical protein